MPDQDENNKLFEILCKHKDSNPSNLNEVFDSYGCNTLEARIPVVSSPVVNKLLHISPEQQLYSKLALKSESASNALEGRPIRTRNRDLKMVQVGGETLLAYGKERDRSPVDRDELDDDIERYMEERVRLKARAGGVAMAEDEPKVKVTIDDAGPAKRTVVRTIERQNDPLDRENMDKELDDYMREAQRLKNQRIKLEQVSSQSSRMEDFDDYDDDHMSADF